MVYNATTHRVIYKFLNCHHLTREIDTFILFYIENKYFGKYKCLEMDIFFEFSSKSTHYLNRPIRFILEYNILNSNISNVNRP